MKLRVGLAGLLLAVLACADLGPKGRPVSFSIVPVFDANGFLAAGNADLLRIRIQRDDGAGFLTIKDTTVAIDADGSASADVNVVLVESPQVFRVLLDAVRSSDGAVLFSGTQEVTVSGVVSGSPPPVQIPVSYSGPRGTRVAIAPRDTVVTGGGSFSFRGTVFDAGNNPVGVPVSFYLVNAADVSKLTLNRLTGAATAVAGQQGDVQVYVMSADSLRDTTHVTVGLIPVSSVGVTPTPDTLSIGGAVQLTATTKDAGNNTLTGRVITWTTSNAGIATVSGSGLVTAVGAGSATITATSEGKAGTATVVVLPSVNSVTVTPTPDTLLTGATVQLTATTKDAGNNTLTGRVVTWVSSTPGVATVNASGLVTGVGAGTTTITATSEGKSGTATVVVLVPIASVTVTPATPVVISGNTVQMTATLKDAGNNVLTGRLVTWSSSATGVATVSATGLVTGVSAGSATITATSETHTGTTTVTVTPVPAGVRVTPGYANAGIGGSASLTGAVLDNLGNPIPQLAIATWVSGTPAVATVNASGGVSGVTAGTSVVVASAFGFSDSALVTVPVTGNVVVSTTSNGRGFRDALVGDIITVDITADMQFATGEKLGSYGAMVSWDPSKLAYIDVQAGDFPFPVVNDASAATGSLNLAQANPNGLAGAPVLARIRFQALSTGNAGIGVSLTDVSGIVPTFTNFFAAGRVTVTNGNVTVR